MTNQANDPIPNKAKDFKSRVQMTEKKVYFIMF